MKHVCFEELPVRNAANISRQLRGSLDSWQNSLICGQRDLPKKTRRSAQTRREREEFVQELRCIQEAERAC